MTASAIGLCAGCEMERFPTGEVKLPEDTRLWPLWTDAKERARQLREAYLDTLEAVDHECA